VLVIIGENHSDQEALAHMPHLAGWAKSYGQASNYSAITHPSLPNYLAIWGGSTFGVSSDCGVGTSGCTPTGPSVFGQTLAAGKTATAYQESMGSPCQTGGSGGYAPRHGPWPYWQDSAERAACRQNDVSSGTTTSGNLHDDIASGQLPVTGELTPNLCDDAHDCSLATFDNWLAKWVPALMAGPDYRSGNLTILITFDEDDGSQGNDVALVAIDPRLSGKTVTGRFSHYSLTKWLDDNAGVPELRNAGSAPDLRAAFGL
jgi:acid phosphatase